MIPVNKCIASKIGKNAFALLWNVLYLIGVLQSVTAHSALVFQRVFGCVEFVEQGSNNFNS
jgi:hypothetical protein